MKKIKETEFTEVKIPVPWGHVAGKWYGPADVRPILMIHGWLDNAGTWDTLIPLLPKDGISYLAIDLPGHGFSSHIPEGMIYSHYDYVWLIHRIRMIYNWPKVSLLGHSVGSILCFLYSGIFAQYVDMIIGLDLIITFTDARLVTNVLQVSLSRATTLMLHHMTPESQSTYTKEELVERLVANSYDSLSPKDCEYFLRRGMKRSKSKPGRFKLTSDPRVKMYSWISLSQENYHSLAKEITCPIIFISANIKRNIPNKEITAANEKTIVDFMKENMPNFKHHIVSGKHHVHLSDPERVSGIISDFILKHRGPKSKI
ncbi:serine hydrolase-like protein isoform X2 [Phlebotomus papatasi]|uniref:AB hydrolase-1 domain-containing protein n=1 Tax=Phlebotomus papatasi TaxID=29031 RepID=A0A1B0GQL9_PHLPP|nr:serine hydrolase-like protein isoform X2 [Phlebotomus papatasi]